MIKMIGHRKNHLSSNRSSWLIILVNASLLLLIHPSISLAKSATTPATEVTQESQLVATHHNHHHQGQEGTRADHGAVTPSPSEIASLSTPPTPPPSSLVSSKSRSYGSYKKSSSSSSAPMEDHYEVGDSDTKASSSQAVPAIYYPYPVT